MNSSESMGASAALQNFAVPGTGYGYTATPIPSLTSFENTLATGLLDESGSTDSFARQMELSVKEIVKSLARSPRKDNLMYRHCHFATNFRQHHGYMPLVQINPDIYDGCYQPGGKTAYFDACDRVIREKVDYAEHHLSRNYMCNGLIYMITDGCDYGSTLKEAEVTAALSKAIKSEALESLVTVLIGVNDNDAIQANLEAMQQRIGFTRYIPMTKADEASLARLVNFIVSASIHQSQALGTGGPSQHIPSLKF